MQINSYLLNQSNDFLWGKDSGQIWKNDYCVLYDEVSDLALPGSMGVVRRTYNLSSKEQRGPFEL